MIKHIARPLVVLAAVTVALLATVTPAHASTSYAGGNANGSTSGGIVWFNRTVDIQGSVTDISDADCGGGCATTAYFSFWQSNVHLNLDQTRTSLCIPIYVIDPGPPAILGLCSTKTVSYHFSVTGPAGGITRVNIAVQNQGPLVNIACTRSGCVNT